MKMLKPVIKLSKFFLIVFVFVSILHASEGKVVQVYQFYPARFLPGFEGGKELSVLAEKYFAMDSGKLEDKVEEKSTSTIWIKGTLFRIDPEGAGEATSIILKSDRDSVIILDHKEKTSLELSVADLSKMSQGIMDFSPAEKPEKTVEAKIKLEKTGARRVINGIGCDGYTTSSSQDVSELWITQEKKELFVSFREWARSMSEVTKLEDFDDVLLNKLDVIDGFPVLVKTLTPAGLTVMEIKSIETISVSGDLFEPPADYTRKSYRDMVDEMLREMQKFLEEIGGEEK